VKAGRSTQGCVRLRSIVHAARTLCGRFTLRTVDSAIRKEASHFLPASFVSRETQGPRLVFDGLPFTDERVPNIAFSRDGNSLYVLSQPGTGKNYLLLKVPIAGGAPATVMDGRLTNFAESMDGRTLFYSRADGIWKRPVEGGAEQSVASPFTSGIWDLRSDGLYVLTNSSSIERYSLKGKRLRTIAKLGHFGVTFPMSVSPDARSALIGYEQRQTVEIEMVESFD
jgi:hypothetical protein